VPSKLRASLDRTEGGVSLTRSSVQRRNSSEVLLALAVGRIWRGLSDLEGPRRARPPLPNRPPDEGLQTKSRQPFDVLCRNEASNSEQPPNRSTRIHGCPSGRSGRADEHFRSASTTRSSVRWSPPRNSSPEQEADGAPEPSLSG
jgi:hypothetical protein